MVVRTTACVLTDHGSDAVFAPRFKPELLAEVEIAGGNCPWDRVPPYGQRGKNLLFVLRLGLTKF